MHAAAGNTNPELITLLLKSGARLTDRDAYGQTSLMLAAWNNPNPEVVCALLAAGARVNDRNHEGMSPLMLAACHNRNPDVVTTLLRAGADRTLISPAGETARDYAKDNTALEGSQALQDLDTGGRRVWLPVPSTGWWDR